MAGIGDLAEVILTFVFFYCLEFWVMFSFCYFQQKHGSFVEFVTAASRICASLSFSTALIYQTPTLELLKLIKRPGRLLNHSY